MFRSLVRVALVAAVTCGATAGAQAPPPQAPRQSPAPSFKSAITVVPLDVRVVDKDGKPITDLTREDFAVLEDGVPQVIAHFDAQVLLAQSPRAGLRASPDTPAFAAVPQDYRVFLIVIGTRGLGDVKRHPETLDALLDFVRHKLLPQDQVALLTSSRATDFTTDHESIARRLEAFRFGDAAARPSLAQAPPTAPAPDLAAAGGEMAARVEADPGPSIDTELGLSDYVKARGGEALGELDALFYGVRYMRFMAGEKHLVFLTETGPHPTWDQVKALTTAANNARVALDTIQSERRILDTMISSPQAISPYRGFDETGQHPLSYNYNPNAPQNQPPPKPVTTPGGSTPERAASPLAPGESAPIGGAPNAAAFGFGGIYDLRYVALRTGGLSTMWTDAAPALGKIDDATRTHYQIAYYPSNAMWDGRFREVTVTVNRPGARVIYRRGYSALAEIEAFDRRRVVSDSRIEAAGSQTIDLKQLEVAVVPAFTRAKQGKGGEVSVPLAVVASRLGWRIADDGRHAASIEIAVYCADGNQKLIGEARRRLNLALTDETFVRTFQDRVTTTVTVPVTTAPRYVKVIVYDYAADRIGSRMVKLK